MTISPFILLCPVFVLCTLGLLLLLSPPKKQRNTMRFFGLFLIVLSLNHFGVGSRFYPSLQVQDIFESLKGFIIVDPLLFFALLSFAFSPKIILKRCWIFLLPPFILGPLYLFTYYSYPEATRQIIANVPWHSESIRQFSNIFRIQWTIELSSLILQVVYLTIYVKILIIDFYKYLRNNISNRERLDIHWILYMGIFCAIFAFFSLLIPSVNSEIPVILFVVLQIIFGFFIYFLLNNYYISNSDLLQSYFFSFFIESEKGVLLLSKILPERFFPEKLAQQKYEDKLEKESSLLIEMEKYFIEKEAYLQKNLCLDDIAKALNTNRTYISQLFSKELNTTFYDYVNEYRVEKAKKLLLNYPMYTLKSLAEECGFSSYTTFVKYFEKKENKNPAEWKKEQTNID